MNKNTKLLEKELKYLTSAAKNSEIKNNEDKLKEKNINIKELANNIYLKRGLDITKLKNSITSNFINDLNTIFLNFRNKDKKNKLNIMIDLIYLILIIVLMKIPFDLIRDIGFEYLEIIGNNQTFIAVWNLLFLVLYTITAICVCIALIKNFSKKYND